MNPRDALSMIFSSALEAVRPDEAVRRHIERDGNVLHIGEERFDLDRFDSVTVLGAGKAAAPMVAELETLLGTYLDGGEIVVKTGHGMELSRCKLWEASHPVPDEAGQAATERMMAKAETLGENDLALVAITGGASSLLAAPALGMTLDDKQETTRLLLGCGADIHEINVLRKHLSRIKGGRLARMAYPATVRTLLVSDVVGDDLDVIGSGPTAPDRSTFRDAWNLIERYELEQRIPESAAEVLRKGLSGELEETPKPGDRCFGRVGHHLLATNRQALDAAAKKAEKLGFRAEIVTDRLVGDAERAAKTVADTAKKILQQDETKPVCLLYGGETTVVLKEGHGRGGRNQHFALALALELENEPRIHGLAAGTDGNDGPTDAAGAFASAKTVEKGKSCGHSAKDALFRQDSATFFEAIGDLHITGPTRTNVMDVTVVLVEP